jgi:hypothetical protein
MIWRIAVVFLLLFGWAEAKPLDQSDITVVNKRKSKAEKEAEIAAAEAAEEEKKDDYARVIVLRWQGTTTDHKDPNLQRNVRSAISKTEALFLPAIDLFQDGREIKDQTLPPELQPASVSEDDVLDVIRETDRAAAVSYDSIDPNEWLDRALQLREVGEKIWFVDRAELREPLFLLYSQIGRSAENLENSTPPLFEYIGGRNVNYYYYLAANLAYQDSVLLSKVTDGNARGGIQYYVDLLQRGIFPSMKVDFEMDTGFDQKSFDKEYEVLINGLPVEIDTNGELDIFLGRSDILMKRKDAGYGLSDRFESDKTEEKAYRVLEIARKRMEVDFIRQLFLYENECKPEIDSDILTYLSIYAKLHPDAKKQIYIAVPKAGNPNKVWVWRFDSKTSSLNLVESGNEEFPVHFIASLGTGALYNGATVSINLEEVGADDIVNRTDPSSFVDTDMISANIPFVFDFRAHYTRFMLQTGIEFGLNLNEDKWVEYYQTPNNKDADVITVNAEAVTGDSEDPEQGDCFSRNEDYYRQGSLADCNSYSEAYHEATFSRHWYIGGAYLFGRDAAFGYGLRAGGRFGLLNMPHSYVVTANVGYTHPLNFYEVGKRIRPVVDADIRLGTVGARPRSLGYDLKQVRKVEPIFGLTITAGTTF